MNKPLNKRSDGRISDLDAEFNRLGLYRDNRARQLLGASYDLMKHIIAQGKLKKITVRYNDRDYYGYPAARIDEIRQRMADQVPRAKW